MSDIFVQLDGKKGMQNMVFPANMDYNIHIVGVSVNDNNGGTIQFIFSDNTRTLADDGKLDKAKYRDILLAKDAVIIKVEMIFFKNDAKLLGIRFFSVDGKVILTTGINYIDSTSARNDTKAYELKTFTLEPTERLIQVRSGQRGSQLAAHHDI